MTKGAERMSVGRLSMLDVIPGRAVGRSARCAHRRAAHVLALAWALGGLAAPAAAATFTVNTVVDAPDAAPEDGRCAAAGGNSGCTLRAAIQEAKAYPGLDEIVVPGLWGTAPETVKA